MIMARHIIYIVMKQAVNPTLFYLKVNYEYGVRAKSTLSMPRTFSEQLFKHSLTQMYNEIAKNGIGAIKLTLSVSQFNHQTHKTLSLFHIQEDREQHNLSLDIHRLRDKYGLDIIKTGDEL